MERSKPMYIVVGHSVNDPEPIATYTGMAGPSYAAMGLGHRRLAFPYWTYDGANYRAKCLNLASHMTGFIWQVEAR